MDLDLVTDDVPVSSRSSASCDAWGTTRAAARLPGGVKVERAVREDLDAVVEVPLTDTPLLRRVCGRAVVRGGGPRVGGGAPVSRPHERGGPARGVAPLA